MRRIENSIIAGRLTRARLRDAGDVYTEARRDAVWRSVCAEVDLRFAARRPPRPLVVDDPRVDAAVIAFVNYRQNGGTDEWPKFRAEYLREVPLRLEHREVAS